MRPLPLIDLHRAYAHQPGPKSFPHSADEAMDMLLDAQSPRQFKAAAVSLSQMVLDSMAEQPSPRTKAQERMAIEVLDIAGQAVSSFYRGDDIEVDPLKRQAARYRDAFGQMRGRRSSHLDTHLESIQDFGHRIQLLPRQPYTVLAILNGGLEPALLAADVLEAPFEVARYSVDSRSDTAPIFPLRPLRTQGTVLAVDDFTDSGKTMRGMLSYLRANGHEAIGTSVRPDNPLATEYKQLRLRPVRENTALFAASL